VYEKITEIIRIIRETVLVKGECDAVRRRGRTGDGNTEEDRYLAQATVSGLNFRFKHARRA